MFNPEMLITAREVRGMSQEELGERVNLGAWHIRHIERGRVHPGKEVVERLADVLHFPIGFFYQVGRHIEVYPLSGDDQPMTGWID